ncbi:DUF4190 domain-containing protein [Catenulispora rubra]|uniref:DUF4190 domain-containing protein n=1 Tax=Catenulispora rubra TaxID=280293 RepID=UPI00189287D5|nr:DUF4190 domain-containing protein [Catenulispora rubra]
MDTEIGPDASDSSRSAEPAAADGAQFAPVEPTSPPPTVSAPVSPPMPTAPSPAPANTPQPMSPPPALPPYPAQPWPAPPYGQQPPNPYGYPPYGYGYGYPYGQPQRPTGTNGLAIASFVLGICGFFVVTPIIGLIFGIVSLAAVRRTGQKGKRLAISGIVLSSLWIAALGTLFTVAAINTPDPAQRSADGTVVSPGTVSVFGLHPKDCFTLPPGAIGSTNNSARTLTVVPCTTAHDSEAFGSFSAAESTFPGVDGMRDESSSQCARQLTSFVPDPVTLPAGTRLQFIYPNQQAWDAGERRVTCFLQFSRATMTHSVYRDPSTYNADQLRFLNAVSPLSTAIGRLVATPDSADISVFQQRANDIASATQSEVSALSGTPWPASVQPAMDALIANHTKAAAVWEQVAGATDVTSFNGQARKAEAAFDADDMIAVRTALGLATPSGAGGGTGTASA